MSNGQFITKEAGKALIDEFQENFSSQKKAYLFDSDLIQELIDQTNCVGVRIYFGQNTTGDLCLVMVGADSNGNDMTDFKILDFGEPCPDSCPSSSYFNN